MTFEDVLLLRLGNNIIEDMPCYMEIMGSCQILLTWQWILANTELVTRA